MWNFGGVNPTLHLSWKNGVTQHHWLVVSTPLKPPPRSIFSWFDLVNLHHPGYIKPGKEWINYISTGAGFQPSTVSLWLAAKWLDPGRTAFSVWPPANLNQKLIPAKRLMEMMSFMVLLRGFWKLVYGLDPPKTNMEPQIWSFGRSIFLLEWVHLEVPC